MAIHRELRLNTPYMKGEDVRAVQKALKVKRDGEYGPATASAVAAWKWRAGYARKDINNGIGIRGQRYLLDAKNYPLPDSYRDRARKRLKAGYKEGQGLAIVTAEQMRVQSLGTMIGWANVPILEKPAGTNLVPDFTKYDKTYKVDRNLCPEIIGSHAGYPWCARSVFLAELINGGKTAQMGLVHRQFNALYCPEILNLASKGSFGMRVVGYGDARPGDLVLFNFDGGVVDHVGKLIKKISTSEIFTVEGNTSADDRGSQNNGGGVFTRHRNTSLVQAYVRTS